MKPKKSISFAVTSVLASIVFTVTPALATPYYWDTNDTAAGFGNASDTWGTNAFWSTDPNGVTSPTVTTLTTGDDANFGTSTLGLADGTVFLTGNRSARSITFGSASGVIVLSGGNEITLGGTGNLTANNAADTISSVLAGGAGVTKLGPGNLTLNGSAVNTFNGGLAVNAGTLTLDYNNLVTPTDLINSSNALTLGGGTLAVIGQNVASATTIQTFNGATLAAGFNNLNINKGASATSATLNLGALTVNPGSVTTILPNTVWATGVPSTAEKVFVTSFNGNALPGAGTKVNVNAALFYRQSANAGAARWVSVDSNGQLQALPASITGLGPLTNDPTLAYQISSASVTLTNSTASSYGLVANPTAARILTLAADGTYTINGILGVNTSLTTINPGTGASNIVIGSEKNLVINLDNTGAVTINAPIANNGSTGGIGGTASNVTIASTSPGNPGITTFGGANTYSGTTIISRGVLQLGNVNALQNTSEIIIAGGGTLRPTLDGVTISLPITVGAAGTNATIGAPTVVGAGPGVPALFTLSGGISGDGGVVFMGTNASNGYGTVVLNAASTYLGSTRLNTTGSTNTEIFVNLGVANALPVGTVLTLDGQNGTGSGRFTQVNLSGNSQTLAGLTNIPRTSRTQQIVNSSGTAATLTLNNSADYTFSGLLGSPSAANLSLTKIGAGEFTISGTNNYNGATIISGGTLTLGNSLAARNSALDTLNSIAGDATNGLRTTVTAITLGGLTGNKNLADVFTTTSGGYDTVTDLTLNPGASVSNSYSAVIADGAAGMTLTKSGAGTQILTGTQIYTGPTTINAGTLRVNSPGSLNAASAVAVNGGILGGSGTINGSVTVGAAGNLSPGASAGTLTIGGGLDISAQAAGAGTLNYELDTLAGTSDKIVVSGTLSIGADVLGFSDFTFSNLGGLEVGVYKLITSGAPVSGTLDPANLTGVVGSFSGKLQITGNDLELVVSPNAYAAWAVLNGLDDSDPAHSSAKNADPDNDGVNNLGEFAFNGNPLSGANNGLHALLLQDTTGPGTKELTYIVATRDGAIFAASGLDQTNAGAVDGLFYTVQGSLDLIFPGSAVSSVGSASDTAPAATGLPDLTGTNWEYHTFRLDASEGLPGKGFLRAKVSE